MVEEGRPEGHPRVVEEGWEEGKIEEEGKYGRNEKVGSGERKGEHALIIFSNASKLDKLMNIVS